MCGIGHCSHGIISTQFPMPEFHILWFHSVLRDSRRLGEVEPRKSNAEKVEASDRSVGRGCQKVDISKVQLPIGLGLGLYLRGGGGGRAFSTFRDVSPFEHRPPGSRTVPHVVF